MLIPIISPDLQKIYEKKYIAAEKLKNQMNSILEGLLVDMNGIL